MKCPGGEETERGERVPTWKLVLVGRSPRRTILRTLFIAVLLACAGTFVATPVRVRGTSMEPAYRNGSVTVINKLAHLFRPPRRGDVVAVRMSGGSVMLLKRVIGVAGETVAFRNGTLYIDGAPRREPYVRYPCRWNLPPRRVGAREVFVAGDNRSMPPENHVMGRCSIDRVAGKALF